jgi:hypothetical protein
MSLTDLSANAVTVELYRRAVKLFSHNVGPWGDCLGTAMTSVQIEMDIWMIAPEHG